jgi:membrane fusion protein, adhesin transport system
LQPSVTKTITAFIDKTDKTYYRARIILQQPYVGQNPQANLILPGMTVESDIMTGLKP